MPPLQSQLTKYFSFEHKYVTEQSWYKDEVSGVHVLELIILISPIFVAMNNLLFSAVIPKHILIRSLDLSFFEKLEIYDINF